MRPAPDPGCTRRLLRRVRLPVLVLLLLVLGVGAWAYRAYDDAGGAILDRSEELPEGRGFAPRPGCRATNPLARLGRWIHAGLDPVLGLPRPAPPEAGEIRLLPYEAAMGPPGALLVRVRHPDGSVVGAAYVTLYAPHGADAPRTPVVATGGEARLEGVPSGPGYVVEAAVRNDDGEPSPIVRVGVRVEPGVVRQVDLRMPGGRIDGQVVDLDTREPVAHARVEARSVPSLGPLAAGNALEVVRFGSSGEGALLGGTVADAEGRFRLGPLAAGPPVHIVATSEDGRLGRLAVHPERPPRDLRVGVTPRHRLTAVVVDEEGRAVAGALVRVPPWEGETRTGVDGRFTLDVVLGGPVVIERGGAAVSDADGPLLDGAYLRFPTRTALDVRVTAASGGPVRHATLYAYAGASMARAPCDETGHARVPVPPGRVDWILVRTPEASAKFGPDEEPDPATARRVPRELVLSAALRDPLRVGEVREVVLPLPPGLVVRGRAVLPDGRPAARARVVAKDRRDGWDYPRAVAADDGAFRISGVIPVVDPEAGEGSIEAEIKGVAKGATRLANARPRTDADPIDVGDVVLRPGAVIRGRVVAVDGSPVPDARVATSSWEAGVRTDERGVYRLPVDPARVGSLRVTATGARTRTVTVEGAVRSGEVRDVEPIVLRPPVTLRVRVVDLEGAPVEGVPVTITPPPRLPRTSPPRTDAHGAVEVPRYGSSPTEGLGEEEGLIAGAFLGLDEEPQPRVRVQVTLPGGLQVERGLGFPDDAPDPFEVIVRVPERFEVVGTVRDGGGHAIAGAEVEASLKRREHDVTPPPDLARAPLSSRATVSDAAGRFRIVLTGVRGERWRLSATADHRTGATDLVAERRTSAEIRLDEAASR